MDEQRTLSIFYQKALQKYRHGRFAKAIGKINEYIRSLEIIGSSKYLNIFISKYYRKKILFGERLLNLRSFISLPCEWIFNCRKLTFQNPQCRNDAFFRTNNNFRHQIKDQRFEIIKSFFLDKGRYRFSKMV